MKAFILSLIEPVYDGKQTAVAQYRVVIQDNSLPYPVFYGTYEECTQYQLKLNNNDTTRDDKN